MMEVWEYRELVVFLIWRNIKARYAQSVIGIGWAVVQPVATMIVFTVIFGRFFGLPSDGVPYPIFSFTALVPWIYFSRALTGTTSSLTGAGGMISKVYFPRLVIPLSTVLDRLVDFVIALALVFAMMAYFQIAPTIWALTLPAMLAIMVMAAMGAGMWLTSLSVQYRDVNYAMGFAIQLLMYTSPVIYPVSMVPERLHLIYALNPMVGVIEGFRA
ncbi:ABC transporter permease, partial [Candidatus Sumerlaeota bacterium]|nr:ABC transporter permease [Candidatus Sumerlaeota bacterium]